MKPRALGVIGHDHLAARLTEDGCDLGSLVYRKAKVMHDGLPYVIEAAFGYRPDEDDDYGLRAVEGFNFTPAIGGSPFRLGERVENADLGEDDPVTVFAHLTSPRLDFLDKGKARVALPDVVAARLMRLVGEVTANGRSRGGPRYAARKRRYGVSAR